MPNALDAYTTPAEVDENGNPLSDVLEPSGVPVGADGLRRVYVTGEPNKLISRTLPKQEDARVADVPENLPGALARLRDYLMQEASPGTKVGNKLFGTGGEERYQTWPEKLVRSGFSLPGDVASGKVSPWTVNPETGDVNTNPEMIERAQDTAGLMGGGAIAEKPSAGTLGSGPMRKVPAEGSPLPVLEKLQPLLRDSPNLTASPDIWIHKFKNVPDVQQALMLPEFQSIAKNGKVSSKAVADFLDQVREVPQPQATAPTGGPDMSRRGFIQGVASTAANASRLFKYVGKSLENPVDVAGAAPRQPVDFFQRSSDLHDSLPSNNLKDAFVNYDEELFHPGMMSRDYLQDMLEDGILNKDDVSAFRDWKKQNPVTPADKEFSRLRNAGHDVDHVDHTLLSDSGTPGAALAALEKAPVFYSALENAVRSSRQPTASAEQWMGFLKNQPGVKPEEMQWTGVHNWLSQQRGPVPKEKLQQYLDAHRLEVKDVTKGEGTVDPHALEEAMRDTWENVFMPEDRKPYKNDYDTWRRSPDAQEQALVHADEIASQGEDYTKYSSYQLPGGENYREHLLTMPGKMENRVGAMERYSQLINAADRRSLTDTEHAEMVILERALSHQEGGTTGDTYRSSHWDEPNVLAHVRMNDRDVGGKKSLHIEEIQSDWHQEGRKKGYQVKDVPRPESKFGWSDEYKGYVPVDEAGNPLSTRGFPTEAEAKAHDEAMAQRFNRSNTVKTGVPDAPFKTTWPELALKRMIRHAAENGYDRVSWTPGEAQAARYDLSKTFDGIVANKIVNNGKEFYNLTGKSGNTNHPLGELGIPADKLSDYVGKELADKIVKQEPGIKNYEGLDLKVGGEGMKEFYDKMLPKMVEKLGKGHGVKVKQGGVSDGFQAVNTDGEIVAGFKDKKSADDWLKNWSKIGSFEIKEGHNPVHYFDLPQSLKDAALGKGFPLFASGVPLPLHPVDHDPFKEDRTK